MGMYGINLTDILMTARCRLITTNPWYGTMASMMEWKESTRVPTMGVRIVAGGTVEALYNRDFCDKLDIQEITAVIRHEIDHIVALHPLRFGSYNFARYCIAADLVVNGPEGRPHIKGLPKGMLYIPNWISDSSTTEEVYAQLEKNKDKCPACAGAGKVDQNVTDGNGKTSKQKVDCPVCKGNSSMSVADVEGVFMTDHDIWVSSTANEDEAKQQVLNMVEQSTQQAGNMPGHLESYLANLQKATVNWKAVLKDVVGRDCGGKRSTYARVNRRHPEFGVKGFSSHAQTPLIVAVDTSGSMSDKDLEMVFTEIEAMSHKFKIHVIQFDHGVKCCDKYHRGDWRNIKIQGRGGTDFHSLIAWMKEKRMVGKVNIILTDGYASWPEDPKFRVIWAIVQNGDSKIPWGDLVEVNYK